MTLIKWCVRCVQPCHGETPAIRAPTSSSISSTDTNSLMTPLLTTALTKRQHCRQLWHCHWLKTDNSHTNTISPLAPTPPLLHCCCSSIAQKVSSRQQTHLTQPDSHSLSLLFHTLYVVPGVAIQTVCYTMNQQPFGGIVSASFQFCNLKTVGLDPLTISR